MEERISQKLTKELQPSFLQIKNKSHLHRGHAGLDEDSGETHFALEISSSLLSSLTKVKAHQIINKILLDEFSNGLHALEIKIIY